MAPARAHIGWEARGEVRGAAQPSREPPNSPAPPAQHTACTVSAQETPARAKVHGRRGRASKPLRGGESLAHLQHAPAMVVKGKFSNSERYARSILYTNHNCPCAKSGCGTHFLRSLLPLLTSG
jgi:hypothetical protein